MSDQTLNSLLETAWQQIRRGTKDRHHPARHPTLATVSDDGPTLRTLVLRAASSSKATLEFHTDMASPKVAQIANNPRVAVHFWVPKASLQIRATATAIVSPGDQTLFAQLLPQAQANYIGPVPGTPLTKTTPPSPPRFCHIICNISALDILHLGDVHRRAVFHADTDWSGMWVAP